MRFFREARSAAALKHPNIINIQDVGQVDGLHYLVMDYVDGQDLKSLMKANPDLDPGQAVDIIAQVARALAYAHSRGVVHRDIKPANIMIDRHGTALVMDFGIAKVRDATIQLTQEGSLIGTPQYMSPEQCQGKVVTEQSDIYSLGVVLYQLLAGRVPFEGGDSLSIIYQHINAAPSPLGELRRNLPPGLIRIVDRMLEKDQTKRYQDSGSLLDDLEQLKAELQPRGVRTASRLATGFGMSTSESELTTPMPVPAAPGTGTPPPARTRLRNSVVVGLAAVLLGGGAIAVWHATRSPSHPSETTKTSSERASVGTAPGSSANTPPTPRETVKELSVPAPSGGESRWQAPSSSPAPSVAKQADAKRIAPMSARAHHRHAIGGCDGTLVIGRTSVRYQAAKEGKDSFQRSYERIQIGGSGARLSLKFPDRKYDFDLPSTEAQQQAYQKLKQFSSKH